MSSEQGIFRQLIENPRRRIGMFLGPTAEQINWATRVKAEGPNPDADMMRSLSQRIALIAGKSILRPFSDQVDYELMRAEEEVAVLRGPDMAAKNIIVEDDANKILSDPRIRTNP